MENVLCSLFGSESLTLVLCVTAKPRPYLGNERQRVAPPVPLCPRAAVILPGLSRPPQLRPEHIEVAEILGA
jgi:hypothetical protein